MHQWMGEGSVCMREGEKCKVKEVRGRGRVPTKYSQLLLKTIYNIRTTETGLCLRVTP